MKASINRDGCISCGVCEATCPRCFVWLKMACEAYVDIIPASEEEALLEARDICPVSIITVEQSLINPLFNEGES